MRKVFISMFAALAGSLLLVACNSTESTSARKLTFSSSTPSPQVAQNPGASARRIKPEELHALWEKGNVLVIDTRNDVAYKQSHIKGAILIPAADFEARAEELPKDKMIVTYCT